MEKKINTDVNTFSKTLSSEQFRMFIKLLGKYTNIDLSEVRKSYLLKNNDVKISSNDNEKNLTNNIFLQFKYKNDIEKINKIMNSKSLLSQINGMKILFYGPTGVGKTTLIKKIMENNNNIKIKNIDFEKMISFRMGQSQINFINLAYELNEDLSQVFVFIDEIDSIVSSRESSDLGEHTRVVGAFIKFLDMLSENVILICSTNYIDSLDTAILRRFNFKFNMNFLNFDEFMEAANMEKIEISSRRKTFLFENIVTNKFTLNDLKALKNEILINEELLINEEVWITFLKQNKDKFNFGDISNYSIRDERELIKIYG